MGLTPRGRFGWLLASILRRPLDGGWSPRRQDGTREWGEVLERPRPTLAAEAAGLRLSRSTVNDG